MADPSIYDFAESILSGAATGMSTAAPDRQYVSPGPSFARDKCNQLVVYLVNPGMLVPRTRQSLRFMTEPTARGITKPFARTLTLMVSYVKDCWPIPESKGPLPPAADLSAFSEEFYDEADLAWHGALNVTRSGDEPWSFCRGATVDELTTVGPTGGYAEARFYCRVNRG